MDFKTFFLFANLLKLQVKELLDAGAIYTNYAKTLMKPSKVFSLITVLLFVGRCIFYVHSVYLLRLVLHESRIPNPLFSLLLFLQLVYTRMDSLLNILIVNLGWRIVTGR